MIDQLTILTFWLNNLLWWHGWVMKFGYTSLFWSCDEVGVVLRWWFQNTDEGSWANHRSESIQKQELEVRRCQRRGSYQRPDSCWGIWILFLCMYVLEFLCTCFLRISVEEYGYQFHRKVHNPLVRKLNCHWNFFTLQLASEKMTAVEDG